MNLFKRKTRPTPDTPKSFGRRCQWLALKGADTQSVAAALKLRSVTPANWATGIKAAYADKIFVSPPLGQWVLAIGVTLPDAGDAHHIDEITPLLLALSKMFEEVQYFGSHRVIEYYGWAKARQGKILRAYAYLGEAGTTLWNRGNKTPAEVELGFNFFDEASPAAEDVNYWQRTDLRFPDEEDVLAIAQKWSVDPLFKAQRYGPGIGVLGFLK